MNFTERDLQLINISSQKKYKANEIMSLDADTVFQLTIDLGSLIGYDANIDDIDALGLEADNVISKLLKMLEERGDM